jgi:PTH1 family peptidyl-tRNA hydrolase
MKLIIGLGNPGSKHQNNRHNVGYMVVDALKGVSKGLTLLKSDCFMNDSGSFVVKKLKAYSIKPEALYVVHDDLDIKLGAFKIQFGRGPKGHNGIIDIEEKLGTSDFWRVRVGVENRMKDLGSKIKGDEYVLSDFTEEEKTILDSVIKQICNQLAL